MKKDLLLLHGALGTKNQYKSLIPLLEDSFDLHCFNFEGHGGRATNADYSIDLFSENVIDYMRLNNLNGIPVFGYSMGGYVALNATIQNTGLFSKVLTLGTKFNWTPESAAKEIKMLNPKLIQEKIPHFAAKLANDHTPLNWEDVMNKTAQMMSNLGNGLALTEAKFLEISVPVHLGIGSNDTMVSVEETKQINEWLPNSKLHLLEDAPHPIEKASPKKIATYIINSLS